MFLDSDEAFANANTYAKNRHREIDRQQSPGHGTDGWVWKTIVPSAIKAFYRVESFQIELACYQRLLAYGVNEIHGLNVPVLEDYDDELRVIETTFVQPPYLLDFGKAALDNPPRYHQSRSDRRRFEALWMSEFDARWPEVSAILHTLEAKYGIYYLDPRPANICFDDAEGDDDDWLKEPPIDYSQYE